MSTEAPLFKDGAQCTAGANLYNPGSALDGPQGSGQFLAVNITAARTVNVQTSAGGLVYGILQNTPAQGQPADVALPSSLTKAVAGAAISAGVALMVDSAGRLVTWASGAGNYIVGFSVEAPTAANQIFLAVLCTPYKVVT